MTLPEVRSGQIAEKAVYLRHLADEISFAEDEHIDLSAENKDSVPLLVGMVIARHSSGSGIIRATALGNGTHGIGLMGTPADVGMSGVVQLYGSLTLLDWTAIIGTTTLSPLASYYLDGTPGKLTTIPPTSSGYVSQFIGVALSAQIFQIRVDPAIYL